MCASLVVDRPTLALRIGVTGHRCDKLDTANAVRLKREISQVLAQLRRGMEEMPLPSTGSRAISPMMQIISPLAEGADRLVAEAALDQGAELIALLPFAREVYRLDFTHAVSRAHFSALLNRATEVIELDRHGDTEESRQDAYAFVGAVIVEQSDVLIALWDGKRARGPGGTGDVVAQARRTGRPVLWLPISTAEAGSRLIPPRLLLADDVISTDASGLLVALAKTMLTQQDQRGGP